MKSDSQSFKTNHKDDANHSIDTNDQPIVRGRYSNVSHQLDSLEKSKPISNKRASEQPEASDLNLNMVFSNVSANNSDQVVEGLQEV